MSIKFSFFEKKRFSLSRSSDGVGYPLKVSYNGKILDSFSGSASVDQIGRYNGFSEYQLRKWIPFPRLTEPDSEHSPPVGFLFLHLKKVILSFSNGIWLKLSTSGITFQWTDCHYRPFSFWWSIFKDSFILLQSNRIKTRKILEFPPCVAPFPSVYRRSIFYVTICDYICLVFVVNQRLDMTIRLLFLWKKSFYQTFFSILYLNFLVAYRGSLASNHYASARS